MVSLKRHTPFLLLALSLPGASLHAADQQFIKTMTVATTIDKNSFYSPKLNIYFEDEILYPEAIGEKFQDTSTYLVVEVRNFSQTAPFNLNHVLYLTENITTCYQTDSSNVVSEILEVDAVYPDYKTTFVKTYIDEVIPANELTETKPLNMLAFEEVDATGQVRYTRYPFTLVFKDKLPKPDATQCTGRIQVMAEFDG